MPGPRRDPHFAEEALHPYVAGELDPACRAVMDQHLSVCVQCAHRLAHVRAIHSRLFKQLVPSEPDELSWHRLRERVRTQLEDEARTHGQTADINL